MEIIEAKNKESFEEEIKKAIENGGKPLYETFTVNNFTGMSQKGTNTRLKRYYFLVLYDS